ncbi:hypothetical protein ACFQI7_25885 [Paenibacillus allorhizosphaerae]|uniref:Uncharacterized protein n=1 Tax=Paenibacillus allorhizosphaerae TaxID=2849866 RepID=A0ABN7TPX1_9BACL|nr:hypothetical protein [Paenibacillus allorhizosphaerae]CAG7645588.1 hypothetical protein PAECIP111802_03553 [Paenibacillus allorhizosphaerae]
MKNYKWITASLVAFMLASPISGTATAAQATITASVKTSLDKIAKSDHAQADQVRTRYNELLALQSEEKDWDAKIKSLHAENQKTLTEVNKQIKQIDSDKIAPLEEVLAQAKERYKPLIAHYTSLNKQISEAGKLKNKELSSMLRLQANTLKIPVQFARLDVQIKESTLREAKDAAANKMKDIRGTLTGIDSANAQIKTSKNTIKNAESEAAQALNALKQALKNGDVSRVSDTLASLVSLSRQIVKEKQTVFNLESKISNIVSAAKAQLP